jgi:hypothetical protein
VVLYSHQDLRVVFQVVVTPITDLSATTSDFMEHLHIIKKECVVLFLLLISMTYFLKKALFCYTFSAPSSFFASKHAQQIFHKCFVSQEIRTVVN